MVDQETFAALLPRAYEWAKEQEQFVLARGNPLGARHTADACLAGVKNWERIRILVVDRIPMPEDPALAEAAKRSGIITKDTRCMGFGYALIVRVDDWHDRELILHNLFTSPNASAAADWKTGFAIISVIGQIAPTSPLAHSKRKLVASRARSVLRTSPLNQPPHFEQDGLALRPFLRGKNYETEYCRFGGVSSLAHLRNGTAKRKGNRLRSEQQPSKGNTETDSARAPLRLAKRKTQSASNVRQG